jgi:hypothetical protein
MLQILGRKMSVSFQEYYRICLGDTGLLPEWIASTEVLYGQIDWKRPDGEMTPSILLNVEHPQHVFEHTAAHELGHIVQFYEGYPYLRRIRVIQNDALSRALGAIGKLIIAVVTDPDTERRLRPYSLWASDRFDATFQNIVTQLPAVSHEQDEPGKDAYFRNALQYAYAKVMLSAIQWKSAEELFFIHLPNAAELGERICSRLPEDTCDTAVKAQNAYESVVNVLGLKNYFITWNLPDDERQ